MNFLLVKKIFNEKDIIVERAEDASSALAKLKNFTPELILMDLCLPGIDGVELSTMIKKNENYRNIPIIAISAGSFPDEIISSKKEIFSDYVEKPLNVKLLEKKIFKLLGLT